MKRKGGAKKEAESEKDTIELRTEWKRGDEGKGEGRKKKRGLP